MLISKKYFFLSHNSGRNQMVVERGIGRIWLRGNSNFFLCLQWTFKDVQWVEITFRKHIK